jgi:hypothetical protein
VAAEKPFYPVTVAGEGATHALSAAWVNASDLAWNYRSKALTHFAGLLVKSSYQW